MLIILFTSSFNCNEGVDFEEYVYKSMILKLERQLQDQKTELRKSYDWFNLHKPVEWKNYSGKGTNYIIQEIKETESLITIHTNYLQHATGQNTNQFRTRFNLRE